MLAGPITKEEELMLEFIRAGWQNESNLSKPAKAARVHPDLLAVVSARPLCGHYAMRFAPLQQEVASTSPEALMAKREAVIQSIEAFAKQAWETGRVAEWMQEADPLLAQVLLEGRCTCCCGHVLCQGGC